MIKIKECKKVMKVCTCCGELKHIYKYYKKKNRDNTYRRESYCKQCKEKKRKNRHKLICEFCGQKFTSGDKNQRFCSNKCRGKSKDFKIKYNCEICGKECEESKQHYLNSEHHFCSQECSHIWQSQNWLGENHHSFSSIKVNCSYCGKEYYVTKHTYESRTSGNFYCSIYCMGQGMIGKYVGEKSPKWNSDITQEEREKGRNIEGYNDFIKGVYERDNYTCQICGQEGNGHNLNAHHINGYNWYKEGRTDINNGITLCEKCHKEFHKLYGKGNNTKEQFEEYLKIKKEE